MAGAEAARRPPAPPCSGGAAPEYTTQDVTAALKEAGSTFSALADEVERRLGKRLSANDLKILLTLYDHLALPGEVILMLVTWCIEETERKYGPGRRPFLSQLRKEGFAWSRQGIDTVEAAEAHLKKAGSAAHPGTGGAAAAGHPGPPPGGAGEDLYRRLAGYGL